MKDRIEPHFGAGSVHGGSPTLDREPRSSEGYSRTSRAGQWTIFVLSLVGLVVGGLVFASFTDQTSQPQRFASEASPSQQPTIHDTAYNMCDSFQGLVEQAVSMRMQGVPISVAKGMADQALDLDPNLYQVLEGSIEAAYRDPATVSGELRNGYWVNLCASKVRGY